jgi:hypothetical protein
VEGDEYVKLPEPSTSGRCRWQCPVRAPLQHGPPASFPLSQRHLPCLERRGVRGGAAAPMYRGLPSTQNPPRKQQRGTCPREAAATGSAVISLNTSFTGRPSSSWMTCGRVLRQAGTATGVQESHGSVTGRSRRVAAAEHAGWAAGQQPAAAQQAALLGLGLLRITRGTALPPLHTPPYTSPPPPHAPRMRCCWGRRAGGLAALTARPGRAWAAGRDGLLGRVGSRFKAGRPLSAGRRWEADVARRGAKTHTLQGTG